MEFTELYGNVLRDIANPVLRSYSAGVFGKVLGVVHNLWWVEERRLQWVKEPNKFEFFFQFFLQVPVLDTSPGRCFSATVLHIVKFESINNAFSRRRESYAAIKRAYKGEFGLNNSTFLQKMQLTLLKLWIYIKDTFLFYMTAIDAAKSLNFNERAQVEALTGIFKNTARAARLFLFEEEARILKNKLRLNVQLIQTCFQCNKDQALDHIESIYLTIRAIQESGLTKALRSGLDCYSGRTSAKEFALRTLRKLIA